MENRRALAAASSSRVVARLQGGKGVGEGEQEEVTTVTVSLRPTMVVRKEAREASRRGEGRGRWSRVRWGRLGRC